MQQFRGKHRARGEGILEAVLPVAVEEPAISGGEHRCAHPERVAGQFDRIDRTKCRRDDRCGSRCAAQVVAANGVHTEAREQDGRLTQLRGSTEPDRAAAFRGDPGKAATAFGVGRVPCREVGVDRTGHVDQRVVGGHLPAVRCGQRPGKAGAELPRFNHDAPPLG